MASSDNPPDIAPSSPSVSIVSSPQETNNANRRKKRSSKNNWKDTIIPILVIIFVLNSINGRKIIDSVHSQFDELSQLVYYSTQTTEEQQNPENKTDDTAVIITSSYIPSLPSTYMVDTVLNSTIEHIIGLSPTAPIFITIDHFKYSDYTNLPPQLMERINKLEQYQMNLFNNHLSNHRVHVIPAAKHLHIGGSVLKAMNIIENNYPTVRYLYSLQHDFAFTKDVDHLALVNVMDEYSNKINYVRFPKRNPWGISRTCGDAKNIAYNGTLSKPDADDYDDAGDGSSSNRTNTTTTKTNSNSLVLYPTSAYSDNNHLVRLKWYKLTIASLIKVTRPPEDPLQSRANNGCWHKTPVRDDITGLYLYHEMNIRHLDGRHSVRVP